MRELMRKVVVFFSTIFLLTTMASVSFADGHGKKSYLASKVLVQETHFGLL